MCGFLTKEKKVSISQGPIVQEKAKILASKLGDSYKVFSASSCWLGEWKSCYGIRQLAVSGEQ